MYKRIPKPTFGSCIGCAFFSKEHAPSDNTLLNIQTATNRRWCRNGGWHTPQTCVNTRTIMVKDE